MRKILFVCPSGKIDAGGEISNHQLILYLVKLGYDVRVVTSWRGPYNELLTKLGIKNLVGEYNWWTDQDKPHEVATRCIAAVHKMETEIRKFKPDVVITNTLVVPWGALAAAVTNTPHIWIAREFPEGDFAYLDSKMGFVKKYANIVMANSHELASSLSLTYNFSAGYFYSYVEGDNIELDNTITETRLVSPNYMNNRKNQLELVQALAILRKRDRTFNTRVVFIGGDKEREYGDKVRRLVKQGGLEGIVSFHGFVNEPWKMVGPNDILVQTSLSESIGRTTTEAMKLGIPVIASDIPGHKEAFELGGGTLYKSQHPEDLADKIQHALANRELLRKTAKEIQNKVLKTMSEEACNKPMVEAIENVRGQANVQGELSVVAPFLSEYITNHERTVLELQATWRTVSELQEYIEALRSSRSYKFGQMQVRAFKRILGSLGISDNRR